MVDEKFKNPCNAYLAEYIKNETNGKHSLVGWYHYIDNPDYNTVGVVATAEVLILIKRCRLNVTFNCKPMIDSLVYMQNSDGGWNYRSNVFKSATEPTARSVQALILWDDILDSNQRKAVQKGITWLLKFKNKSSLWGPINKKEKDNYTYFSCVVLQSLQEVILSKKEYDQISLDLIKHTIDDAIKSLLESFHNSDVQCGWGITNTKEPTIFHTAYTVYTILSIDSNYKNKHPIIKSLKHIKEYFVNTEQHDSILKNDYSIGEGEIFQYRAYRLVYTHSVDVYTVLALLQDPFNHSLQLLIDKCKYYISCAEKTDWRYREYITCWRLYDIVTLCDHFTSLLGRNSIGMMKHFKIAFSFAGESRDLVREIAERISSEYDKSEILFDDYYEEEFARPQLDIYLQKLYHDCTDLIVVFLCENYTQKKWCGIEWRSIRDILNNFDYKKIMYVKVTEKDLDEVGIPGFYASEDGYVDANKHTPEEIAQLIIKRHKNNMLESTTKEQDV